MASIILFGLALVVGILAFHRSQLPYNEEGRFFDADDGVVYHDGAVSAYGAVVVILALGGGALLVLTRRSP